MCKYIYHHYPACGHIASFTLDACIEMTNSLRRAQHPRGHEVRSLHDLLPVTQVVYCLRCEVDYPPGSHRDRNGQYTPLEGLDSVGPIITADVTMSVPTSRTTGTTGSTGSTPTANTGTDTGTTCKTPVYPEILPTTEVDKGEEEEEEEVMSSASISPVDSVFSSSESESGSESGSSSEAGARLQSFFSSDSSSESARGSALGSSLGTGVRLGSVPASSRTVSPDGTGEYRTGLQSPRPGCGLLYGWDI